MALIDDLLGVIATEQLKSAEEEQERLAKTASAVEAARLQQTRNSVPKVEGLPETSLDAELAAIAQGKTTPEDIIELIAANSPVPPAPVDVPEAVDNPKLSAAIPDRAKTEQELRVEKLNKIFQTDAFYAGQGITAKLQPNGVIELSNVVSNPRPNSVFEDVKGKVELTTANLRERLNTILSEPSTVNKQDMFVKLQEDAALLEASMVQKAYENADKILGIPQMQADLARMQRLEPYRLDRHTIPNVAMQQLEQRLNQAMTMRDKEVKAILDSNFEYQSFVVQKKAIDQAIQNDIRQQTIAEQKRLNSDMLAEQRRVEKEMAQEAKIQQILDSNPRFVIERAKTYLNDPAIQDDKAVALKLSNKSAWDDDVLDSITAPPEKLLRKALSGNKTANDLFLKEEAARIGRPVGEIVEVMSEIQKLHKNPEALSRALAASANITVKEAKETIDQLQTQILIGSKEDKANAEATMWDLAIRARQAAAEEAFLRNMNAWPEIQHPELLKVIGELGSEASLEKVIDVFVKSYPKEEWDSRMDVIRAQINKSTEFYNRSPLLQFSSPSLIYKAEQLLLSEDLRERLKKILEPWASGAPLPLG